MMQLLAQAAEPASNGALAETIVFWILAVVGVGAGIAMVTSRNIVHAALFLVVNFFAISGLYLTLQSSFLSIVQIIVYAGAIMVLFLFVIMLLGIDRDDRLFDASGKLPRALAGIVGAAFAVMMVSVFVGTYTTAASACGDQRPADVATDVDGVTPAGTATDAVPCVGMEGLVESTPTGSVGVIGESLFTRYTFAFETAALLLTVATLGALVLGRRHDPVREGEPGVDPAELLPDDTPVDAIDAAPLSHGQVEVEGILTSTRPTQDQALPGREPSRATDHDGEVS